MDRPLAVVLAAGSRTSLKDTIHNTDSLPGVGGDYPLSSIPFGTPGARRLVCLTDGSTLEEQVLDLAQSKSSYRFRYVVWNYTTEKARPIFYGVGEFRDWEIGGGLLTDDYQVSYETRLNSRTMSSQATSGALDAICFA